MLEIGTYNGKNLGIFGDNKRIGAEILEDNSLSHLDTVKAIVNTKGYIRDLSIENDKLYDDYEDKNLLIPIVAGVSIPAIIYFVLKVTNIDSIYVGADCDFNNFVMHNGNMLSFSEFVSALTAQASCILTPTAFVYFCKKRNELIKKMQDNSDYITYFQLVLGALRKHAYNLGMKADYELGSTNNEKRVLTPEKNIEK